MSNSRIALSSIRERSRRVANLTGHRRHPSASTRRTPSSWGQPRRPSSLVFLRSEAGLERASRGARRHSLRGTTLRPYIDSHTSGAEAGELARANEPNERTDVERKPGEEGTQPPRRIRTPRHEFQTGLRARISTRESRVQGEAARKKKRRRTGRRYTSARAGSVVGSLTADGSNHVANGLFLATAFPPGERALPSPRLSIL